MTSEQLAARLRARAAQALAVAAGGIQGERGRALSALRAASPIRTGRLRGDWSAEDTQSGLLLHNGTEYAGFLQRQTGNWFTLAYQHGRAGVLAVADELVNIRRGGL